MRGAQESDLALSKHEFPGVLSVRCTYKNYQLPGPRPPPYL